VGLVNISIGVRIRLSRGGPAHGKRSAVFRTDEVKQEDGSTKEGEGEVDGQSEGSSDSEQAEDCQDVVSPRR